MGVGNARCRIRRWRCIRAIVPLSGPSQYPAQDGVAHSHRVVAAGTRPCGEEGEQQDDDQVEHEGRRGAVHGEHLFWRSEAGVLTKGFLLRARSGLDIRGRG